MFGGIIALAAFYYQLYFAEDTELIKAEKAEEDYSKFLLVKF